PFSVRSQSRNGRCMVPLSDPNSGLGCYGASGVPSFRAISTIQPRYRSSGVIPVRPPQPAVKFGPVDQLTTPIILRSLPEPAKVGAPESPAQAPNPAVSPLLTGSNSLICSDPGCPVTISGAARTVPPVRPSPRTVTP